MKRLLPVLIILAILPAGPPAGSEPPPPPCGFIAEAAGRVVLQRNGRFYLLKGMEGVNCGESVRVLKGARAVYAECGDNQKFEIPGPAEFTAIAGRPILKSGQAGAGVKISADLCPFFLAQAVTRLKLPLVDADGNAPERLGTEIIYKPLVGYVFNGYLDEIKGDVYFASPQVLKLTGDAVPNEEMQILSRSRAAFTLFSCGEGVKYRVEGSALARLNEIGKNPRVEFLRGQAATVEKIGEKSCLARREELLNGKENTRPAGLDGK